MKKFWKFYDDHGLLIKITALMICMLGYGYDASLWLNAYANYLNTQ